MIEMKYLSVVVILFVFMIDATVVNNTIQDNNADTILYNNDGCKCIQYNCGCCHYLDWNTISVHGLICTNASYLVKDYGFSVTVTFNNLTVVNETISARNPPPICFGEDIIPNIKAEICLRFYDININKTNIHLCFELEVRAFRVKTLPIKLGCVNTENIMVKKMNEVENMINKSPSVVMV